MVSILLNNRSKLEIQKMIDSIILHPEKIHELMSILMDEKLMDIHYRAAWVLGYLAPLGSDAFENYFDFLLQTLEKENIHPTITRSITRLFQYIEIPEKYQGQLIDSCFKILTYEMQELAQRANSMTILYNYSKKYPDIQSELRYVIQEILEYKKEASIQSRGQKTLKQLNKTNHEHQH